MSKVSESSLPRLIKKFKIMFKLERLKNNSRNMFCVICTTFSSINYHFRFSENKEIKKLKDERTILHKKATNLYLKKKLLKKENEKLNDMLKKKRNL